MVAAASQPISAPGDVVVGKTLSSNFHLFIKHPDRFSGRADHLVCRYRLFRHPLAVLASWQTVDMAVRDDRLPLSERPHPDLRVRWTRSSAASAARLRLYLFFLKPMGGLATSG
jgi:hypothetical protein